MFDLKDFGMNCMDYQMIKNLIWLLSRHYPERLGVCLVINAPTLFSGCWAVIKGWYVVFRFVVCVEIIKKISFLYANSLQCNYFLVLVNVFILMALIFRLDENTSSKVIIVSSEEELCKHLIPDILPSDM